MLLAVCLLALLSMCSPVDVSREDQTLTDDFIKNDSTSVVLSRKKRLLVFPPNSAMTLSACLAKGGIILSPPAFVFTFDWDLAFALPDKSSDLNRLYPPLRIHRKDRRDLYDTMEGLLERQGLNGRACVLRTLCEAQQVLAPGKDGLMEDIFHAIFTLPPPENSWQDEDEDLRDHDTAHRHGRSNKNCAQLYSSCPVSLINLALW